MFFFLLSFLGERLQLRHYMVWFVLDMWQTASALSSFLSQRNHNIRKFRHDIVHYSRVIYRISYGILFCRPTLLCWSCQRKKIAILHTWKTCMKIRRDRRRSKCDGFIKTRNSLVLYLLLPLILAKFSSLLLHK